MSRIVFFEEAMALAELHYMTKMDHWSQIVATYSASNAHRRAYQLHWVGNFLKTVTIHMQVLRKLFPHLQLQSSGGQTGALAVRHLFAPPPLIDVLCFQMIFLLLLHDTHFDSQVISLLTTNQSCLAHRNFIVNSLIVYPKS